jgi:hypothetical protein
VLELRQDDLTYTVEARAGDETDCLNDDLGQMLANDDVQDLRVVQFAPTWYQGQTMAHFEFTDATAPPGKAERFARLVCSSGQAGAPGTALKTVETTDPEHATTILEHVNPRPPGVQSWGYGRPEEPVSVRLPENGWEEIGYALGTVWLGIGSGTTATVTFFPEGHDAALPEAPAGSHHVVLRIDARRDADADETASGPTDVTLDPAMFQARDERGKLYDATTFRWDEDAFSPPQRQRLLQPGQAQALTAVFDVPDDRVISEVICWCAQPLSGSDALGGYQSLATGFGHERNPLIGTLVFPAGGDHDILVAVANAGNLPLEIDPARWRLASVSRVKAASPTSFTWVFPEGTVPSAPLALAPGDVAVVLLDFGEEGLTGGDSLVAIDAAGRLVELDNYSAGGGAGGGAPVLIDID